MTRLIPWLWGAVFAGLLAYLGLTIWLAISGLAYPYQLDYGEGPMLEQAGLLARGLSIYKPIEGYPYAFSNYPPLLQALSALLVPLFGLTYAVGRVWNVIAIAALTALIYHVVRRQGGDRVSAAVAALAFAGSPYIYRWAPLFRVDLPGLILGALGVAVIAASGKSIRSSWAPPVAGLLFVLSLYTKHSLLAAPAAAFIFLWLKDRAAALRLAVFMALTGGGAFLVINAVTAGAFYTDLITTNVNPFSLSGVLGQAAFFAGAFAVILAAAFLALAIRLAAQPRRLSVWHVYFVTAIASIALAGKVGSWENYFFEPLLLVCIMAGLGISALRQRGGLARLAVPLALLLQVALMFHTPQIAAGMMAADAAANVRMAPILAAEKGIVLSEEMGLLVTNGRRIPYFGFEYTQLARMGLWDQRWELDSLRQRAFPLVILEAGTREEPDRYHRFTRAFLSELDRSYALTSAVGRYRLYRPAPLRRELSLPLGSPVALAGYRVDPDPGASPLTLQASAPLTVSLLWRAATPVTTSYTVFVHLVDEEGKKVAQHDGLPFDGIYPTTRWAAGELVRDTHTLTVPAGLPPGRYSLRAGMYETPAGSGAPATLGAVNLASLRLGPPQACANPAPAPGRLGPSISLSDFSIARPAARSVTLTACWRTDHYLSDDYTIFVQLLGADGKPVDQFDGQPLGGALPTSLWEPGDPVSEAYTLTASAPLPPGKYRLVAGMYLLSTGQRLAASGSLAEALPGANALLLGEVTIP